MSENPRTMDLELQYSFRRKVHTCKAYIDVSKSPCFIFIDLWSKDLILEFGEEIAIKTDCESLLPREDDYPELICLRQAIFDSIKSTPEFLDARQHYMQLSDREENNFAQY